MAYIDDLSAQEKGNLLRVAITAGLALALLIYVLNALGLNGTLARIGRWWEPAQWIAFCALWRLSYAVVSGFHRGVAMFGAHLAVTGTGLADRIGVLTAATLAAVYHGSWALLRMLVMLAMHPVRCLCEVLWDCGQARAGALVRMWNEEQAIRQIYRAGYRGQFGSFLEFRRHFENPGMMTCAQDEPARAAGSGIFGSDEFTAACKLLGLPQDGAFGEAELSARYRKLMIGIHPDVAGPNDLAAQVNVACALIRKRKGW